MSQAGPLPYLEFSGVEVANAARTIEYLRSGLGDTSQGRWELGAGSLCSVLYRTSGVPSTFVSPASDPAPWYDPSEPGSSTFLGLILLGLKGYDSTVTRGITNRINGLGGGTFGAPHKVPRVWNLRAAMISSDDAGAEFGLRWLTAVLQTPACAGCSTGDIKVRLVCPPANGSNDALGEWASYEVALTAGPTEVEQYLATEQPEDRDVLAGCRDVVIVEFTLTAGNPFLYKRAALLGSDVLVEQLGDCHVTPNLTPEGDEITDATRATHNGGDNRGVDSSYGFWPLTANRMQNGSGAGSSATDWSAVVGGSVTPLTTSGAPFSPTNKAINYSSANVSPQEGVAASTRTGEAVPAGTKEYGGIWIRGSGSVQLEVLMRCTNTDASVTDGTPTNITVPNGTWQRFVPLPVTVAAGKTGDKISIVVRARSGVTLNYTIALSGAQIESISNVATPYIATNNSVGIRLGAGMLAPSADLMDDLQGWAAFRIRAGLNTGDVPATTAGGGIYLMIWGTANNHIGLGYVDGVWFLRREQGGVANTVQVAQTFARDDHITIVAAWTGTRLQLSINGSVFTTAAATRFPDLSGDASFALGALYLSGSFSNQLCGDIFWAAFGKGILGDAQAAGMYAFGDTDETGPTFNALGPSVNATTVWPANTVATQWDPTAEFDGICAFLFGPPTEVLCEAVTAPLRGTLGAIFTVQSNDGFGNIIFQAWPDCSDRSGDPVYQLELSSIPADSTVVVDSAKHTITVTDGDGNVSDGQHLITLPEGRGLEWIESSRECDTVGCFCVATPSCAAGTFTIVSVEAQAREG